MPKSQAGHVLKIFLNFWEISAWCSYKLGSYKKSCFWSIISPHTKFCQNRMKNAEVENCHYWSRLVGLVGQKMVIGIWNSFYVIFGPLLAPSPNFIQIGRKTQKLIIFAIGRFWLVGLVGRKMVAATSNIRFLPNLNQIGWKLAKLAHREIFSHK